jgi:hypothetical protein
VSQLLQRLDPATAPYRLDLLTRQYAQLKGGLLALLPGAATLREPWFDMEALAGPLQQGTCAAWAAQPPAPDMCMPPPNPYIATDFSLHQLEPAAAGPAPAAPPAGTTPVLARPPAMILDRTGLRLWYKGDAEFRTPRTSAFFRLWSPALHASPRAAALSHLLLKLLDDVLNEDAYLADVAGLHYHTSPEGQGGVELRVDGFSHKHAAFVQRLFGSLVGLDPARPSFAAVKESLVRRYTNANMQVGTPLLGTLPGTALGAALAVGAWLLVWCLGRAAVLEANNVAWDCRLVVNCFGWRIARPSPLPPQHTVTVPLGAGVQARQLPAAVRAVLACLAQRPGAGAAAAAAACRCGGIHPRCPAAVPPRVHAARQPGGGTRPRAGGIAAGAAGAGLQR